MNSTIWRREAIEKYMKSNKYPRIIIGAGSSGAGKTTITCAIIKALVNRKLSVASFKCGPDYIDTMFHGKIVGEKSRNLDPYFFSDNTLRFLLANHAEGKDISVIEGVMGYYDGISMKGEASTYEVASITDTPAILIVNAKAAALSIIAEIEGFLNFKEDSKISGVIFNGCTEWMYPQLKEEVEARFNGRVMPLGFLPNLPEASLESRHLGLVTADEVDDIEEKLALLSEAAEKYLDIDGIINLANSASESFFDEVIPTIFFDKVRIAVARDKAFCFYYEDSLALLEKMGAEIIEFSPLGDECLPEGIDGVYLGGGYPEIYANELKENQGMRKSIKDAIEGGMPCIAECGGFMYLLENIEVEGEVFEMTGALPRKSFDAGRLVRFGYIELEAKKDNMLCALGEKIRGHEFHHWDAEFTGEDFVATRPSGKSWPCVFANENLYAGYPHFHFYSNLKFAENFYKACLKRKEDGNDRNN